MLKKFLRICSVLIVLAMVINMLPMSSLAAELDTAETQYINNEISEDVTIVGEVIESRTEFSKEFRLSNGLHMATVYPYAVHYAKGGQWEDIDNSLQLKLDGTYTNKAGAWNVAFPTALTAQKYISITKDGYTLSFAMAGELSSSGEVMASPGTGTATESLALNAADGGLTSATTSIELNTAAGTIETFAVGQMQSSTAAIEAIDLSALRDSVQFEEMLPEKVQSRLVYNDVYQNTNVVYDLASNQVK